MFPTILLDLIFFKLYKNQFVNLKSPKILANLKYLIILKLFKNQNIIR